MPDITTNIDTGVSQLYRDLGSGAFAETMALASTGFKSQVIITRPANVTPYTAGDVIGGATSGIIEFTSIGLTTSHLLLTTCDIRIDTSAVPPGISNLRLYLYDSTPASNYGDNVAWDLPASDRAAFMGYIDFLTPSDLGSTLFVQNDSVNKQVKLAQGSTSIFAYLVTLGGFTPAANSEVYVPTIRSVLL